MRTCRYYWPDAANCVWINFSLPIVLVENHTEWNGYQLTTENLEKMWNTYGELYLGLIGLKPYVKPDDDFMMLMWILIIGGVTAAFAIVLFIARYLMINLMGRKEKCVYQNNEI